MVSNGGNTLKARVITHPKIDNLQRPANDEPKYNFLSILFFKLQTNTAADRG